MQISKLGFLCAFAGVLIISATFLVHEFSGTTVKSFSVLSRPEGWLERAVKVPLGRDAAIGLGKVPPATSNQQSEITQDLGDLDSTQNPYEIDLGVVYTAEVATQLGDGFGGAIAGRIVDSAGVEIAKGGVNFRADSSAKKARVSLQSLQNTRRVFASLQPFSIPTSGRYSLQLTIQERGSFYFTDVRGSLIKGVVPVNLWLVLSGILMIAVPVVLAALFGGDRSLRPPRGSGPTRG